jgi:hypothetical protein
LRRRKKLFAGYVRRWESGRKKKGKETETGKLESSSLRVGDQCI